MKKTIHVILTTIIFSLLLTFQSGCKKKNDDSSNDSSNYFIKFKVNGVQKEFGNTSGIFTQINVGGGNPTIYTGSFQGVASSSTPTVNNMGLSVNDIAAIAVNKNYKSDIVGPTIAGSLVYMDAAGLVHGSDFVTTGSLGADDAIIRLTEISSTSVSGTFSGKVAAAGSSTTLTITEGSFRVKRM